MVDKGTGKPMEMKDYQECRKVLWHMRKEGRNRSKG